VKVHEILSEDGRIVKGVNTTTDVGVGQIPIEAKKFGNTVDRDGHPPTLSTKVKGKSTNVLYNLGLTECARRTDEGVGRGVAYLFDIIFNKGLNIKTAGSKALEYIHKLQDMIRKRPPEQLDLFKPTSPKTVRDLSPEEATQIDNLLSTLDDQAKIYDDLIKNGKPTKDIEAYMRRTLLDIEDIRTGRFHTSSKPKSKISSEPDLDKQAKAVRKGRAVGQAQLDLDDLSRKGYPKE